MYISIYMCVCVFLQLSLSLCLSVYLSLSLSLNIYIYIFTLDIQRACGPEPPPCLFGIQHGRALHRIFLASCQ